MGLEEIDSTDPDGLQKIQQASYTEIPGIPEEPPIAPEEGMKWVFVEEMSDEFDYQNENDEIDTEKWTVNNPTWVGRAPAYFKEENVYVKDSTLFLQSQVELNPPSDLPEDFYEYETIYSTAFVRTKQMITYGFFEVYCIPMDNTLSSAFWFADPQADPTQTELDIFEYSTSGINDPYDDPELHFKNMYNTNRHVFKDPSITDPIADQKGYNLGFDLSSKRMKVGFNWQPDKMEWYLNDVLVRTDDNQYFHNPLYLQFDSEAFPDWHGLPDPPNDKLPNQYKVFCVRTWQQVPTSSEPADGNLAGYYKDKYKPHIPPRNVTIDNGPTIEIDGTKDQNVSTNQKQIDIKNVDLNKGDVSITFSSNCNVRIQGTKRK